MLFAEVRLCSVASIMLCIDRLVMMISSNRKAKIIWQCRRGMLELDIILGRFSSQHLDAMPDKELTAFEALLDSPDPDLYAWLMDYEKPEQKELEEIVAYIRVHDNARNIK